MLAGCSSPPACGVSRSRTATARRAGWWRRAGAALSGSSGSCAWRSTRTPIRARSPPRCGAASPPRVAAPSGPPSGAAPLPGRPPFRGGPPSGAVPLPARPPFRRGPRSGAAPVPARPPFRAPPLTARVRDPAPVGLGRELDRLAVALRLDVAERTRRVVEDDVQLPLFDALVEPGGAEHEPPQPVHERAVGRADQLRPAVVDVLAERRGRILDLAVDGQVDEVLELGGIELAAHEAELARGLLDALGEVVLVEREAQLSVLEDVVLAGVVVASAVRFHHRVAADESRLRAYARQPPPGRLHLMPDSCLCVPGEADLSRSETIAKIEGPHRVRGRIREVEEAHVHALTIVANGERLLDRELAAPERRGGQLDGAEAQPRALGLAEELDVDLGREHLVQAAHIAPAGEFVVVLIERRAARRDARAGPDHPVAEGRAPATLGDLGAADLVGHFGSVLSASGGRIPAGRAYSRACAPSPPPSSSSRTTCRRARSSPTT